MNKKLTIGIMYHSAYDAIHSTLQSIRLYHSEILGDIEIIILDSHPMGVDGDQLKLSLLSNDICEIPVRYIANNKCRGSSEKQIILEYVSTPYFLYMEPGTLMVQGSIGKLIKYFDSNLDKGFGILQGIEFDFALKNYVTHTKFIWHDNSYGIDDRDINVNLSSDVAISVDGARLNVFACRMDTVKNIKLFGPHFLANSSNMDNLFCDKTLRFNNLDIGCLPSLRYTCSHPINGGKSKIKTELTDVHNYAVAFLAFGMEDDLAKMINQKANVTDPQKVLNTVEMVKTKIYKL